MRQIAITFDDKGIFYTFGFINDKLTNFNIKTESSYYAYSLEDKNWIVGHSPDTTIVNKCFLLKDKAEKMVYGTS